MRAARVLFNPVRGSDRLLALQRDDGHARALHYQALVRRADPPEAADLMHFLCLLHGRRPGVIDHAAIHAVATETGAWLEQAAEGFVSERLYITRLTVAAGPVSGASESDHSEAAAIELRRSIQSLATSERRGCAAGAALAFALDWPELRHILDPLARRLSIDPPPCELPKAPDILDMADRICGEPGPARAFLFGADQMFQLQRVSWRLLSARAKLRAEQLAQQS